MNQVIEDIQQLTKDFTKQDTVIVHAGSNDLQSSNTDIVSNVKQTLSMIQVISKKTNDVLNTIPARYDDFQLQQRGRWVNNMIDQIVDESGNKSIVVNHLPERMGRECFAYDGLHYNRLGKSLLCERICSLIQCHFKPACLLQPSNTSAFFSKAESAQRLK